MNVIRKCWDGQYESASQVETDLLSIEEISSVKT